MSAVTGVLELRRPRPGSDIKLDAKIRHRTKVQSGISRVATFATTKHLNGGGPRPGVSSESKMCTMTKGLLLHVDPPVKQIILDLDDRFSNSIVKFELVVSASTSALYEGCP